MITMKIKRNFFFYTFCMFLISILGYYIRVFQEIRYFEIQNKNVLFTLEKRTDSGNISKPALYMTTADNKTPQLISDSYSFYGPITWSKDGNDFAVACGYLEICFFHLNDVPDIYSFPLPTKPPGDMFAQLFPEHFMNVSVTHECELSSKYGNFQILSLSYSLSKKEIAYVCGEPYNSDLSNKKRNLCFYQFETQISRCVNLTDSSEVQDIYLVDWSPNQENELIFAFEESKEVYLLDIKTMHKRLIAKGWGASWSKLDDKIIMFTYGEHSSDEYWDGIIEIDKNGKNQRWLHKENRNYLRIVLMPEVHPIYLNVASDKSYIIFNGALFYQPKLFMFSLSTKTFKILHNEVFKTTVTHFALQP